MSDFLNIICRGKLRGIFTGFHDSDPVNFEFDNGQIWQQNERYYFYYGLIAEPEALVVEYFGRHFLFVSACSEQDVGNLFAAGRPCEVIRMADAGSGQTD